MKANDGNSNNFPDSGFRPSHSRSLFDFTSRDDIKNVAIHSHPFYISTSFVKLSRLKLLKKLLTVLPILKIPLEIEKWKRLKIENEKAKKKKT